MIRSGKAASGGALLSLVVCSLSFGTATPYQGIVDRNIFGLKPPPPPTAAAEAPKTPLPPITLNGITTLLGTKRAFLSLQMPAKPPEPAKPQSFMLSEGQRDGDIEMIEIDVQGGSVKINAFGTITNVPFAKVTSSSPPPTGGAPGGATGIPAPPPNPFSPGGNPGFNRSIPSRTLRMPGMSQGGANPGMGQNASAGAGGAPTVNTPGGNLSFSGAQVQGQQQDNVQPQQPAMSAEAYALMLEAERERTKDSVMAGKDPPIPTTKYTPPGSVGSADPATPDQQQAPVVNRRGPRGF